MDGPQEIACGLVVPRGNGTILLESGKEVLNQMPGAVLPAVMVSWP